MTTIFNNKIPAFIQLDYPPYSWKEGSASALQRYITQGKAAGWIGFHHASLLGLKLTVIPCGNGSRRLCDILYKIIFQHSLRQK